MSARGAITARAGRLWKPAAALLAALWAAAPAPAQDQPIDPSVRPTVRFPACTTSGCHAAELAHEYVHAPTAVSACDTCHDVASVPEHTFVLKSEQPELCNFCHIDKLGNEGPVVHDPYAKGHCLSCHDPHGSNTRKMLRRKTMKELCVQCHEETLKGSMVHEPAGEGDCTLCHGAHTSEHARLLVKDQRSLCLSCHETMGEELTTRLHVHEPATGDCLQCHAPHASDYAAHLISPPAELCGSCHVGQVQLASGATHKHSAVLEGRACLNCHTPHASSQKALQYADPIAACLECHGKQAVVDRAEEQVVATSGSAPVFADRPAASASAPGDEPVHRHAPPASELVDDLPVAHGPVKDADCAACHDLHGAENSRLLTLPYPETFYQPFTVEAYALCFNCHDRRLVLERETSSTTRFRDGQRNLHAVHVNSEQGRTCRACHTTHASKSAAMIGEAPPYGQWRIPLNFEATETGGSCGPGCHKPASYDRVSPVLPPAEPAPEEGGG